MAVGSGTGTPIPIASLPAMDVYDPTEELDYLPNCAVSLPRYAKLVGYEEAAFWGVVYTNQQYVGCAPIWNESERMKVGIALGEAQQQIEEILGYPLCPTWIVGVVDEEFRYDNRWVDQQRLRSGRLLTRYPRVIAAGIRATATIAANTLLTQGAKVAVVGPIATDVTNASEIHVYYPGSNRRIYPSKIILESGAVTVYIPRYRLVIPDLLNTPEGGIMYENMDAYLTTVDIMRVYNDPSKQAVLVSPGCNSNNCTGGCGECTRSACMYLRDNHIGEVDVRPADYNEETLQWTPKTFCSGKWQLARLNYLAGMRYLNLEAEEAIIRLAHTKLHGPPCSCDYLVKIWETDNTVPRVLTRERINCPLGQSQGAWTAYRWARNQASIRASIF